MIIKRTLCLFIVTITVFSLCFHTPNIVKAVVNSVPSNYRENAQNYAYQYWNMITDDEKYVVWLGKGTNFKKFISGDDIYVEEDYDYFRNIPVYYPEFRKAAYSSLNSNAITILKENNIDKADWINNITFDPPIVLPCINGSRKYCCPDDIIWNDANDCAHFISNCIGINGGGIPLESYYSYAYGQTSAEKLAKWIIDNNYAKVYYDFESQKPQIGDVIIWKRGSGRHTTIVVSDEGGLAFHTRGSYDEQDYISFPQNSNFELAYFFHFIPDNSEQPPDDDYLPDLIASKYRAYPTNDDNNRSNIEEGESFSVDLRVDNIGNGVAEYNNVAFYLSTDEFYNPNDDFCAYKERAMRLDAGEYVWIETQFYFPDLKDSYFSGTYSVWIYFIIDCDFEVDEINENNDYYTPNPVIVYDNQDSSPPEDPPDEKKLSDLTAPKFSWSPESATEGNSFTIEVLIKNIGEGSAESNYATIYLSTDDDFDISDDYKLVKKQVPYLDPSEEVWIEHTFYFPVISMSGLHLPYYNVYLICYVDSDSVVNESDEDNIWKCKKSITVYE